MGEKQKKPQKFIAAVAVTVKPEQWGTSRVTKKDVREYLNGVNSLVGPFRLRVRTVDLD